MKRVIRFGAGWLTLALAGLLACALLRAFAAVIYLGVPVFDWQWYVPVTALLVAVPVHLASRWLRPRTTRLHGRTRLALMLLAVWIVLGLNGFGQSIQLNPDTASTVPISFWAFSDFRQTSEAVLKDLQTAQSHIYLSIGDVSDDQNAQVLVDAMHRLSDYGIEVFLAPSLSNFLSVPVYQEWITRAQQTADLIQAARLSNVRGLIGDAEPPMNWPPDLLGSERPAFDQAIADLGESIGALHQQFSSLQIGVTANWPQFVDVLDNDTDLSLVARSPVNPPGRWDFVNLMTYSSYFPPDWRAYYVYLLEQGMARLYPTGKPGHLIGLVGAGFPGEPLLGFDDLVRDARLTRAMGVTEIVVFQLTDALRVFGQDFVGRIAQAVDASKNETLTVNFSRPVSLLFFGTVLADSLLDVYGSRAWLWIGWLIVSGAIAGIVRRGVSISQWLSLVRGRQPYSR